MLRPKQMSRVSVTGSKRVMETVIETVHDLNLVHLVDYDGSWEGFDPGNPIEGADETSEQLVTVRSIENILAVTQEDAGPTRIVDDEELTQELEETRQRVNELDDRRDELRDEIRSIDERTELMEPFSAIGIDLDLFSGYESIEVAVGEGDVESIERALADADAVEAFETFADHGAVAIFAYPADGHENALDDALVGVEFTAYEIPDAEGSPEEYLDELHHRRQQVESRLRTVENELEEFKLDVAGFLLAAEEKLTVEVQRREAPLSFATTESAFLAEGWIPTDRYDEFERALAEAVGDHVEVEELQRADYDEHGLPEHGEEAATDGGTDMAIGSDRPPVIPDNPALIRPFELLVRTISRPRYSELDPTILVFLTFPTFFGFMIGDLGYGIFYTLVGYLMFTRFDSPGLKSLGGVAIWAGFFTMVFGILYGEFFGLHVLGEVIWGGHPPIEKGLNALEFALLWLFVAMVIGLVHVGTGYVLDFANTVQHSVVDAVLESASWFMLMFGVWIWILSKHLQDAKPDFIFHILDHGEEAAFALGFAGFSEGVGIAALVVAAVGLVLMVAGEVKHEGVLGAIIGPLESLNVLVNILSYARITAVLLAKAGMAFVVNLLVFGVVSEGGHFALTHSPEVGIGLIHQGPVGVVFGLIILVLGHATVWALGITSAGLQAIRLEYVEFFQKFYEGGGETYEPFGYDRSYTADQ